MLFNSYLFVFIFLPVSLTGFYIMAGRGNGKAAKLWLAAVSLWFYGSFRIEYLLILLGSAAFNYGVYLWMGKLWKAGNGQERGEQDKEDLKSVLMGKSVDMSGRAGSSLTAFGRRAALERPATIGRLAGKKVVLAAGVAGNLALLGYFKYTNFFLENLNMLGGMELPVLKILLPVGISFFTFQQISFLIDAYRGEIEKCGIVDYLLYIVYFPKLVEGPLVNPLELFPQFAAIGRKAFEGEKFIQGIALFIMGMLKKVILADTFGGAVDYGYSELSVMHGSDAALLVVFYALQLYFDFSGYCDMARGVSWMFGIELPVNFNSPYQAGNIIDFWKRWHITLNRFFTKYVYIPLGGNREGKTKMYRNLLIVFLLSGIWHGAGWNFILWGMMHGLLYVLTRMWQEKRNGKRDAGMRNVLSSVPMQQERRNGKKDAGMSNVPPSVLMRQERKGRKKRGMSVVKGIGRGICVLATFLYVSVAWVYFRAESVAQGSELLAKIFQRDFVRVNRNLAGYFNLDEFWYVLKVLRLDKWEFGHYILMAVMTAGALLLVFFGKNAAQWAEQMKPRIWNSVLLAGLLFWCVLTFSNVSTFLYFNF